MFDRLFGSKAKVATAPRVEPEVVQAAPETSMPVNLQSSASVEEWREMFDFIGGDEVTRESAMKLTAVFGCVSLLAGTIGTLGARVMKPGENGGSEEHKNHEANWLVHHEPHENYTPEVFFEGLGVLAFLDGNGQAEIVRNRRGDPVALRPILEGICKPFETSSGRLAYRVTENGDTYGLDKDDVLHFRGSAAVSKYEALSPIKSFGRTIGIGLDADEYARLFYKQGGTPSGYITYEGKVDEKVADEVRNYWMRKMAGVQNSHLPAVLAEGGKFVSLMQDPETAQLMQSRSFQVSDVARAFGIPPHLIGETNKSTSWGTGINAQTAQFYILGLRKHVKRFEGELTRKLLTRAEREAGVGIKFNLDTLLRADLAARYEAYKIALGGTQHPGWMSVAEIRDMDGLPSIDDDEAKKLYRPVSKGEASKSGDSGSDPVPPSPQHPPKQEGKT